MQPLQGPPGAYFITQQWHTVWHTATAYTDSPAALVTKLPNTSACNEVVLFPYDTVSAIMRNSAKVKSSALTQDLYLSLFIVK